MGLVELTSNQTLSIDGGAIVTGRVVAQGDNIQIRGDGQDRNFIEMTCEFTRGVTFGAR